MNIKNKTKSILVSIISIVMYTILNTKTVLADVAVEYNYKEVKNLHIMVYIPAIIVIITGIIILVKAIKNRNIITIILSLLSIIIAVAFMILIPVR